MKRIKYFILFVIFILAACSQAEVAPQAATATQQATATCTQTATHTSEPTPTPEVSYVINTDLPTYDFIEAAKNYDSWAKEFSNVTLEDITSGRLLEYEKAYLEKNPVFTDEVIPSVFEKNYVQAQGGWKTPIIIPSISREIPEQIYKPDTRPLKIISYYKFQDEKLFDQMGMDPRQYEGIPEWPIWIATWAYKNPSGNVTIGHSIMEIFAHVQTLNKLKEGDVDFKPYLAYKYENVKETYEEAKLYNPFVTYILWKNHPDLQPDEDLIDEWVKTGEMDEELQKDLFFLHWYPLYW